MPLARSDVYRGVRVCCDSMVAMGARTASGRPIFAKNSDRPANECQPLKQLPSATHEAGAQLRCQYIDIDQVGCTNAVLGAGPYWLWGLEHGLNEHGLAVGNHTIFTKDAVPTKGLQGMDLVRLALERSASASQAVDTIVGLIERYGQGGSGFVDADWPYHNSFLCADPTEAWLLEASAGNWVAKRADEGLCASNHTAIGSDWDRIGPGCAEHARAEGYSNGAAAERFDFAAAYRDTSVVPPGISSGRFRTTSDALGRDGLAVADIVRVMRDHYDGGEIYAPHNSNHEERFFSVCAHADPVGTTTASMVVELTESTQRPWIYRASVMSPCIGPYLPLFGEGSVPTELTTGGAEPSSGGAWWRFHALRTAVEQDFVGRGPVVREHWRELERTFAEEAEGVADEMAACGDGVRRSGRATEFMNDIWARTSDALDRILTRVG